MYVDKARYNIQLYELWDNTVYILRQEISYIVYIALREYSVLKKFHILCIQVSLEIRGVVIELIQIINLLCGDIIKREVLFSV